MRGNPEGIAEFPVASGARYRFLVLGILREFENSHYQYEKGLFTPDEFEARLSTWRRVMGFQGTLEVWANEREAFAPSFRAEIDRIVAEVGG